MIISSWKSCIQSFCLKKLVALVCRFKGMKKVSSDDGGSDDDDYDDHYDDNMRNIRD